MTTAECSQIWLVDAVRDRRVTGREAAQFERHRPGCRDCLERTRELLALKANLQALPSGVPSQLVVRRQRQGILRELAAPHRPKPPRFGALLPAFVALALAAAVVALLRHRAAPMSVSWVEVTASEGSHWEEHQSGSEDRITLHNGHYQLSIRRPSARSRVILFLPDGKIEDVGTVLEIWIANGHTDHVAVQSGEVMLQLGEASALRLRAGEHWSRLLHSEESVPSRAIAPAIAENLAVAARSHDKPLPGGLSRPSSRREGASSSPSTSLSGAQSAPPLPPSKAPNESVPIAEDVAYSRLLKLLHGGDRGSALESARDYLRRYPEGFRRVEVMQIASRLGGQH